MDTVDQASSHSRNSLKIIFIRIPEIYSAIGGFKPNLRSKYSEEIHFTDKALLHSNRVVLESILIIANSKSQRGASK
jgi:hypothetical protein